MSDLKIRDVRTIITHQPGARTLTVVKVETDEPELYGLGCASFCTRPRLWPLRSTIISSPFSAAKTRAILRTYGNRATCPPIGVMDPS